MMGSFFRRIFALMNYRTELYLLSKKWLVPFISHSIAVFFKDHAILVALRVK